MTTPPVVISGYIPEHSSIKVLINPFPGAVDYLSRITFADGSVDTDVKSAGGAGNAAFSDCPQIEVNGLNAGDSVTIYALSALMPFMTEEQMQSEATKFGDCQCVLNGHGDPIDPALVAAGKAFDWQSIVIGQSVTFVPTLKPFAYTAGSTDQFAILFDKDEVFVPRQTVLNQEALAARLGDYHEWASENLVAQFYCIDMTKALILCDHGHMMVQGGDGLGAADASILLTRKDAAPKLTPGDVIHFSTSVDAHNDSRRYAPMILLVPDGNNIIQGALHNHQDRTATPQGDGIYLFWMDGALEVTQYVGGVVQGTYYNWFTEDSTRRATWPTPSGYSEYKGTFNGTDADIDNRHSFDVYISNNHITVYETAGTTVGKQLDVDLAVPIKWDSVRAYYSQVIYHTSLEMQEDAGYVWAYGDYWIKHTQDRDLRHWGRFAEEKLKSFAVPETPVVVPITSANPSVPLPVTTAPVTTTPVTTTPVPVTTAGVTLADLQALQTLASELVTDITTLSAKLSQV